MMEEEKIKQWLDRQNHLCFTVSENELEAEQGTVRYFDVLSYIGQHPACAAKFCGKWQLTFQADCGKMIWNNSRAKAFVRALGDTFSYLFFLAEKESATLKLLVILTCQSSRQEGEELSLDREQFNRFFKAQLKGLLIMSAAAGFSPENAQSLIQSIYDYFGLSA